MGKLTVTVNRGGFRDSVTILTGRGAPKVRRNTDEANFEESKHPRNHGKFAKKGEGSSGGSEAEAPKNKKGGETASKGHEEHFTSHGVTGSHEIHLVDTSVKRYTHGMTVQAYIDSLGGDRKTALRRLKRDHDAGRIKFSNPGASEAKEPGKAEEKPAEKLASPPPELKKNVESKYQGTPQNPDSALTPEKLAADYADYLSNGSDKKWTASGFEDDVKYMAKQFGLHPDYAHNLVLYAHKAAGTRKVEAPKDKHDAPKELPHTASIMSGKPGTDPYGEKASTLKAAQAHTAFIEHGGTEEQKKKFDAAVQAVAEAKGWTENYAHNKVLQAHKTVAAMQKVQAAQQKGGEHFGESDFDRTYPTHMSYSEYQSEAKKHEKATAAEAKSMRTYSGGSYMTINHALRKGDTPQGYEEVVKHVDALANRTKSTSDKVLWRGVKGDAYHKLKDLKPGDVLTNSAFTSASHNQSTAHNFSSGDHLMVIRAKKGSRGAYMGTHTNHQSENEVVLPINVPLKYVGRSKEGHFVFDHDT